MSADSILRDKLFEKGATAFILSSVYGATSLSASVLRSGFLKKLFPLLERKHTRHMALVALATITHHGGTQIRTEIAKHTPILVRLMRENKSDPKVLELAIITISHAVQAVLLVLGKPPDPKLVKLIGLKDMLDIVLESIRYPWISALAVTHAIPLLACSHLALLGRRPETPRSLELPCRLLPMRRPQRPLRRHGRILPPPSSRRQGGRYHSRSKKVLESYERGAFKEPRIEDAIVDYGFQDTDI
jgi:hypothetical protein